MTLIFALPLGTKWENKGTSVVTWGFMMNISSTMTLNASFKCEIQQMALTRNNFFFKNSKISKFSLGLKISEKVSFYRFDTVL